METQLAKIQFCDEFHTNFQQNLRPYSSFHLVSPFDTKVYHLLFDTIVYTWNHLYNNIHEEERIALITCADIKVAYLRFFFHKKCYTLVFNGFGL